MSQGREGGRGHWGGSEEEFLESNMGTFKFRAGNAIFARGTRQWHRLEGTKILTKPLPGTRNNQDVNDAQRGIVGGNDDDD